MKKSFKNALIVIKQTAYDHYSQLKLQGRAPLAIRWERLKDRHATHSNCVQEVSGLLNKIGMSFSIVRRDEMHRGLLADKDLVISIGGDGTLLNVSAFLDANVPLVGINSDPSSAQDLSVVNKVDERRSKGALCAVTAVNIDEVLPRIIYGDLVPGERTRSQCLVRSTYVETRLPPSLNDILIAHPLPAAVTRFRLTKYKSRALPSFLEGPHSAGNELFSFHAWSSGMWICTATGSSAAMQAAGGILMDKKSKQLQYRIREHLLERSDADGNDLGHGMIDENEMLHIRYNSHVGAVFVDGSHIKHNLELGDEIKVDSHAPCLKLFDRPE